MQWPKFAIFFAFVFIAASVSAQQRQVSLYNKGPAVFKQSQSENLKTGEQRLYFAPLARALPGSLWLDTDTVNLLSANYPKTGQASLQQAIGQMVSYQQGDKTEHGILRGVENGRAIVETKDKLIELPENIRLSWPLSKLAKDNIKIRAQHAGRQTLYFIWQQSGLNWQAHYTAQWADDHLVLKSWALVENNADHALKVDQFDLIAGQVNRNANAALHMRAQAQPKFAADSAAPQKQGDYYRYHFDKPLALAAQEHMQWALMPEQKLKAPKNYAVEGMWSDEKSQRPVQVRLKFDNATGSPLPAGPIRIYSKNQQLLGEDQLSNTAAGAPITLYLGQAFDLYAKHQVIKAGNSQDQHWRQIRWTLHNQTDEQQTIHVIERLPEDAKIDRVTHTLDKRQPQRAHWMIKLPAHGKTELSFRLSWPQNK